MKVKNTTGLRQIIIIGGKKVLARANDVFEVHEDFSQHGFEQVPDDTPVTERRSLTSSNAKSEEVDALREMIEKLQNKVSEVEREKDEVISHTFEEVNSKVEALSDNALALGEDVGEDVKELKNLVVAMKEQGDAVEEVVTKLKEGQKDLKATTYRRLEILKSAMQAMELQIDEFEEVAGFNRGK